MKKYIEPQFTMTKFHCEDILTTSSAPVTPDNQGNFKSSWIESLFSGDISGSGEFKQTWKQDF